MPFMKKSHFKEDTMSSFVSFLVSLKKIHENKSGWGL